MKFKSALLIILAALTWPLCAGEKLAVLKLADGTEYKSVEIMGVSPKGVRILHASGAANVPVDQLPANLQTKYGAAQKNSADEAETKAKVEAAKVPAAIPPARPAKPAAVPVPAPPVPTPAPAGTTDPVKPLPQIVGAKVYGIAEVLAEKFKFDGKIVKVDVVVNSASKIEQISAEECQIFVGDPFTKLDSDYAFLRFPEAGRKKIETMLSGARGRMTLYVQVEAAELVPLKAVGRSTVSGAPGTPVTVRW